MADEFAECTDLVLVCCHAVYTGDGENDVWSEGHWRLQSFQQADPATGKPSEHETMIAHIVAGALAVERRPQALLMFSGGRTTTHQRSEAEGYAKVLCGLRGFEQARQRCALEEFATDSYQNLLFSVLRFRFLTGRYPSSITVITHAFKERRFLALHAPAIRWPASRIRVQGINPPFTREELQATQLGEEKRGYTPFVADPYGVRTPIADKRLARNWKPDAIQNELTKNLEPVVYDLLRWKGGETGRDMFPQRLPWESE